MHVDALIDGYKKIGVTPTLFPADREPPRDLLKPSLRSLLPGTSVPEFETFWNQKQFAFIHLHNAFPVLGPRFFRWAIAKRVPIALTVHNHRFFCTNGLALRDKRVCRDCFSSKVAWRPLLHNCNGEWKRTIYHSLALSEMRLGDLYRLGVKRFVAPSPYLQGELIRSGMPRERVRHILNPVFWSDAASDETVTPHYDAIYAGRLSQEKGIQELLAAIRLLPAVKFLLAGDGPERSKVELAASQLPNLEFVGAVEHERVLKLIAQSRVAVLPSICNETLSTFALEAFYQGKRCVVPALDSTSWLASGDFPGHLARAGDPQDLARSIEITLSRESVSIEHRTVLRRKLGFDRFCGDLKQLVREMLSTSQTEDSSS